MNARNSVLQQLQKTHFDLIIVGGGIHGATLFREAVAQGLKTCLIEKDDFCAATSANSLKIIHGGFRYLQHANIKRMRESIKARKLFIRAVPNQILPLPCILPTVSGGLKSRPLMKIALRMNDMIGWDRNKNIPGQRRLAPGKIISREEFRHLFPLVDANGYTGGAKWHDSFAFDTERTTLEFILQACDDGGFAANYLSATALLKSDGRVVGIRVKDKFSGDDFEIDGAKVVLALGPWLNEFLVKNNQLKSQHENWCYGLNLVLRKKLLTNTALGLEGSKEYKDEDALIKQGKRMFFLVPWRGYTMVGTDYKIYNGKVDDFTITREQIESFLSEINAIYPAAKLHYKDVSYYQAGILPMKSRPENEFEDIQLQKESEIIFHETTDNLPGLVSILSIKYTTAPIIAQNILKSIVPDKGKSAKKHKPTLMQSSNVKEFEFLDLYRERYGLRCDKMLEELKAAGGKFETIQREPVLTDFEIKYLIKNEFVLSLSDLVLRRTGLGTAEMPAQTTLSRITEIMAAELGWDDARMLQEMETLRRRYAPLIMETDN